MKKFLLSLTVSLSLAFGMLLGSTAVQAAGDGISWDKAPARTNELGALQNGAKVFANYCLSCHSAAYMRYNRLQEIGLTEKQIKDNLMFATDKVGDTMKASIDPKLAKEWFGGNPPDLTLVARSRADAHKGAGPDYLYTLLRTYYRDDTKATGWNNLAYPNIGMPNPLWELQGERSPVMKMVTSHGKAGEAFDRWEQTKPGKLSPREYEQTVGDLVGYLQWMAEPSQNSRVRIGVWVLLFLSIFTILAWRLNAAYWKDIK